MQTRPKNAPTSFHLLAKPTGAMCNLDCKYCFFLSKELLYPSSRFRMADEVLETYIRQLVESQEHAPEVTVAWQGGEPTLMGLEFFQRSIAYAEKYKRPNQQVVYTIQTNGTKIDDAWAAFFKANNFLVGLSVDGPCHLHDTYRVDKGGAGSFDRVIRGWKHLVKHGVDYNILCTVHAANQDYPLEVYRFFRDELGVGFIQFIPIVERATPDTLSVANEGWSERPLYTQSGKLVTERSVGAEQYGRFLIEVFDEWVRRDVGQVFVQMFDVTLGSFVGQHNLCIFAPTCGHALALEHNGDLYACDHYVEPDYKLGNIQETHMIELAASDQQRQFGRDKRETLPRYCRECEVRFACHGGCPRNRFINTPGGEASSSGEGGLNYLCAGYKLFFNRVRRPMSIMAQLLREGRYADEIMQLYAEEVAPVYAEVRRNEPCPCGSGKKYKYCHGRHKAGSETA
jgi:uncharacterized protein